MQLAQGLDTDDVYHSIKTEERKMKKADIKIGGHYMTWVPGGQVAVEVIGVRLSEYSGRPAFLVQRLNYGIEKLDNYLLARTAAALHPIQVSK